MGSYTSTGGTRDDTLPHDSRRGSSRYRTVDGWAAADAIADRWERQRALDVLRARARREERAAERVPDTHVVTAVLADALGLALPMLDDRALGQIRASLRRALAHRRYDPAGPAVVRALDMRLRPHQRIVEAEVSERTAAEVHERLQAAQARRSVATAVSDAEFRAMFSNLDDDGQDRAN